MFESTKYNHMEVVTIMVYLPTGKQKKHTNLFLFIITDRSKLVNNMQYGTEQLVIDEWHTTLIEASR